LEYSELNPVTAMIHWAASSTSASYPGLHAQPKMLLPCEELLLLGHDVHADAPLNEYCPTAQRSLQFEVRAVSGP
jgi:hypothetical protein